MSKVEKIAFIRSFWSDFFEIKNLNDLNDLQLNILIKTIIKQVQERAERFNAVTHVLSFPVFLN